MDKTPLQWMIEPLRRYAQFSGRARRAEYWWFVLFGFIVALIAFALDSALGLRRAPGGGPIGGLTSLALFLPQLAVSFRRLHDIDRSGWWVGALLILFLPFGFLTSMVATAADATSFAVLGLVSLALGVYSIVLIVWSCQRGTAGPNRFGPDPLADRAVDHLL